MNTTGGAVDKTIDVDGTAMRIVFGADEGNVFTVTVSGTLDFGPVSIEGTITWSDNGGKKAFGGTGLTVFFGDGPLTLGNGERNPMAKGLLISDATVGVVWDGVAGSTKYAMDVTGTVSVLGIPDVTLGGTVRVRYNAFGTAVNNTIPVGTGTVAVVFGTGAAVAEVTGTGLTVAVLGQQLSGDLVITKGTGGLSISVSNLSATLAAGGTPFLTLTGGAGTLLLTPTGVRLGNPSAPAHRDGRLPAARSDPDRDVHAVGRHDRFADHLLLRDDQRRPHDRRHHGHRRLHRRPRRSWTVSP